MTCPRVNMSFEDNKDFWMEFINMYRDSTCLWHVKSKHYRNRQMKNAAYDRLVAKCKELVPNANRAFVLKKISSLRSSFRRQMRKLNETKNSGAEDLPTSTLWYFDHMGFILEQDEEHTGLLSLDSYDVKYEMPDSPTDTSTIERNTPSPQILRKPIQNASSWLKNEDRFIEAGLKFLQEEPQVVKEPDCQEKTFGTNVGQQLISLEERQKIIAQKLISDVLFYAKIGNLNENTTVQISSQPSTATSTTNLDDADKVRAFHQS